MTQPLDQLTLVRPDDWHLHVRDGAMLRAVIGHTARQFGRAIIMPNLTPPVTTTAQAQAYKARIDDALNQWAQASPERAPISFTPLMTLYLTDNTPAEEIRRAADSGIVYAVKLYPAGATTNSDAGVTDLLGRCSAVLEQMQALACPY